MTNESALYSRISKRNLGWCQERDTNGQHTPPFKGLLKILVSEEWYSECRQKYHILYFIAGEPSEPYYGRLRGSTGSLSILTDWLFQKTGKFETE